MRIEKKKSECALKDDSTKVSSKVPRHIPKGLTENKPLSDDTEEIFKDMDDLSDSKTNSRQLKKILMSLEENIKF